MGWRSQRGFGLADCKSSDRFYVVSSGKLDGWGSQTRGGDEHVWPSRYRSNQQCQKLQILSEQQKKAGGSKRWHCRRAAVLSSCTVLYCIVLSNVENS